MLTELGKCKYLFYISLFLIIMFSFLLIEPAPRINSQSLEKIQLKYYDKTQVTGYVLVHSIIANQLKGNDNKSIPMIYMEIVPSSIQLGENVTISIKIEENNITISEVNIYYKYTDSEFELLTINSNEDIRFINFQPTQVGDVIFKVEVTDIAGKKSSVISSISVEGKANSPLYLLPISIITAGSSAFYLLAQRRKKVHAEPEKSESISTEPSSDERYANFAFYDNKLVLLKQDQPLEVDVWYNFEVSVRGKRIGVQPETQPIPLKDPTRGETVEILVSLESSDFEIKEPVKTLILPPKGDSTENAWFEVKPTERTVSKSVRSEIVVLMFYNLYLIEADKIKAEIVSKRVIEDRPLKSMLSLPFPIEFEQERFPYKYGDFEKIKPRAMNIDITKKNDLYNFKFTIKKEYMNKPLPESVRLSASVSFKKNDLDQHLEDTREILNNITMSKIYQERVEFYNNESLEMMRKLAIEGKKLYTKLFSKELGSSISIIGKFLIDNPIEKGGIIHITMDENANDFVFPWALIFDGEIPEKGYEVPDLDGFWGIRYIIEQMLPIKSQDPNDKRGDEPFQIQDKLSFNYFLWDSFSYAQEHTSFLLGLKERSKDKINVSEPTSDKKGSIEVLLNGQFNILYFYAHGFTRPRKENIEAAYIRYYYKTQLDKMDSSYPDYAVYKEILEDIGSSNEEIKDSWIQLRGRHQWRLYLTDLEHVIIKERFKKKPIVILNMCCSAQISPTLSGDFVSFFINRGAISVIGTECSMTPLFAHKFGEFYLEKLLQGDTVGNSLLETRKYFMNKSNPLGLAYTLYGSSTVNFIPNLLQ